MPLAFPMPLCLLITGESFEQSAFENKLYAVFFKKNKKIKIQQMYWKYASGGCGKGREGDENVQTL